MKIFLDTNVLVAASIRQHPHFLRADAILRHCESGDFVGVVHSHSLLEFHSAVTQLPKGLAVPPAQVEKLLAQGILPFVRQIALTASQVRSVQVRAGQAGLIGGIIYDLQHLTVALREKVDRLYTFNVAHFRHLAPENFQEQIVAP